MELIWTSSAISDLKEFKNYSKMQHPKEYISNLINNVSLLIDQPYLGKIYSYVNGLIIRQFIHEQHRIFYYIKENTILIISVVHHRQNIHEKYKYIKDYFNNEK